jgi:CHAT domain-containing protein
MLRSSAQKVWLGALVALGVALADAYPREEPAPKAKSDPAAKPVVDPTPTDSLTKSLDLDLTKDPRPNLKTRGSVEWESGKLTLGADGAFTRTLEGIGQARFSMKLSVAPLTENGQTRSTRFVFQTRGRGDFVVEILRRRVDGQTLGEVRLTNRDAPGPADTPVTRVVRVVKFEGEFPDDPWVFRHHFGLVTVYCGDRLMLVAAAGKEYPRDWAGRGGRVPPDQTFYQRCGIGEPLEVVGWALEQEGGAVTVREVTGKGSESFLEKLPPNLQKMFGPRKLAKEDYFELSRGVRDIYNLRLRMSRHIPVEGQDHHALHMDFEPWKKGEPNFRELGDRSLTSVAAVFGKKHHYYAIAIAGVGAQFFWTGDERNYDAAERLLKQAAEIAEGSVGMWHPDCLAINSLLARVYMKTGKLDLAEPVLKKVSEATTAFGTQSPAAVTTLQDSAALSRYNGRLADAETALTRAVDASKNGPVRSTAVALTALGELQFVLGEREKAADALKRADEMLDAEIKRRWDARENPAGWKPLYVDLGRARVLRARLLLQDKKPGQARELVRSIFLPLVQISDGQGRPGRFPGWNEHLLTAYPDTHMIDHPSYGSVMIDIVDVFVALGDTVPATNAVRMVDMATGLSHHDRGVLFRAMARLCELDPNVNVGIRPGFSERMRLDAVYRNEKQKDPKLDRVEFWLKHALKELEEFVGREHPDTIRVLLDLARRRWFMFGAKEGEKALMDAFGRSLIHLDERALAGFQEVAAYQYLTQNAPPIDLLLSCYQASKVDRARDAYEMVWRAKALETRQLVERRQLLQLGAADPAVSQKVRELQATREELARLSLAVPPESGAKARADRLLKLGAQKEELEKELAKLSEPFRRNRDANRAGIGDAIGKLPAKSAVVDFVERWEWSPPEKAGQPWARKRLYDAFILRPTPAEPGWFATWVTLGDADALEKAIDDWAPGLRPGAKPDARAGELLRKLLWAPLERSLTGAERVIVIPDGRLGQVPFSALPGSKPGTYLLEDYALGSAPYGQFLARLNTDPALAGNTFLIAGGIDYGPGGKWGYLKGTETEAEELEKLRPGPNTVRLKGADATKKRLQELLPNQRYVHLATHGDFLDPTRGERAAAGGAGDPLFNVSARNPLLLSMLVLAGANRPATTNELGLPVGSDGFLTAEEVMGLNLSRTELVVLSACETGVGKVRGGEGTFSLQRAFHVAGSRAVVASLWKVPDNATQALMTRFHENLSKGRDGKPMGKLDALREAQLWLMKEARARPELLRGGLRPEDDIEWKPGDPVPPYYWAAFTLSGDWR